MNFLPVIARELQVQARRPALHRTRWIAAGVVMSLWVVLMQLGGRSSPEDRGHLIFLTVGFLALGYVMLTGIFQTADCLSRERREGTLGLMFLTDLKGYDVVLGKLASTSLHSFYTFLAVVPVLSLTFLLGGMTWGEFWRVTLVLVATLYLSLAVGMFASAFSRDARVAMGGTLVLLVTVCGVVPMLWWWTMTRNGSGVPASPGVLAWGCPPYAFRLALDDAYVTARGAAEFWNCIATFLGLGSVGLAVASGVLPHSWQDHKNGKPAKAMLAGWPRVRPISPRQAEQQRKLRQERPLLWLATRDGRPRRMATLAFAVLLPIWGGLLFYVGFGNSASQPAAMLAALGITYGLHLLLKCLIAAEASRLLIEDRQSGMVELLLVAPLAMEDIIHAQLRGIWRSFRRWAVILVVMNLTLILFTIQADVFRPRIELTTWAILGLAGGTVLLYVDGCALVNTGLWMAMSKKNYAQAFLATVRRVLLPPWLLGAFFFVNPMWGGGIGAVSGMMLVWFIIVFVMDVCIALPTMKKLRQQFRSIAALGNAKARAASVTHSAPPELVPANT
jgi:hypothetical protein